LHIIAEIRIDADLASVPKVAGKGLHGEAPPAVQAAWMAFLALGEKCSIQ